MSAKIVMGQAGHSERPFVGVNNVFKSFGDHPVLVDVSFSLKRGEIIGVVGPSGSGKSVLLKLMGGVIEADAGSICFDRGGCKEPSKETEDNQGSVGYLFQEGALFDSMSVIENVIFPMVVKRDNGSKGVKRNEAYRRGFEVLAQVGLGTDGLKFPGQLSGGMRRRVALARALVSRPELVLLDDPTAGLDPVAASVIMNLIIKLHNEYLPTVVLVSQDIRRLIPNVERIIALFDGRVSGDLTPDRLVTEASPRLMSFLATRYDFSQPHGSSQ